MELSYRLNEELNKQGKTQAALAAHIGVSAATVSQWRSGGKQPSVANVTKIASFLGVSPAWLQYGTDVSVGRSVTEKQRDAYRLSCRWYLRDAPRDGGRELGDAAGFAFKVNMETLARESGQNITDEALSGEPTVTARYTVMELSGHVLADFLAAIKFDDIRPHLDAAATSGQKVATVLKRGLEALDDDRRLICLRVEDYGASGLLGEEYDSGRFMAVMRNKLDSYAKGDSAGGSYGLGSSVLWASSQFGLVLMRSNLSVAQEGKREGRFLARLELPWHRAPDEHGVEKAYAGPGWFGEWDEDNKCTRSYWGDDALANDTYLGRMDDRPGTSFLIVGAYDPSEEELSIDQMHEQLKEALAKNFWPAMVEQEGGEPGRLTAVVRSERNGRKIQEDLIDPNTHAPAKAAMLRAHREDETVDALENPGDVVRRRIPLNVPRRLDDGAHGPQEHYATLLITEAADDTVEVNRVSFTRGSMMVIKDVVVPGVPMGSRPFHALVLCGLAAGSSPADRTAERFLRAAEPPTHDNWEITPELSRMYARGYGKALRDFSEEVRKAIKEIVSRPTRDLSDGPDALKELLRITPIIEDTTRRPKVKSATGKPDAQGRWAVDVTVSLPPRREPWQFSPMLRFGTESGAPIPVIWEDLQPVDRCTREDGSDVIAADAGARRVRFTGVTSAATHPVGASRATAIVDIKLYKGSAR